MNKIVLDIFANIFDYYPDEKFINIFLVDGTTNINVNTICDHNLLKLSIVYSFVWKEIYNTYPTKKDFMDFIKQHNYKYDSIINIDKTILEQILNSFMHIRLGVTKNINLELVFKKFEAMINNLKSHNFITSFIRSKLRYRFLSRLDFYDDIEDINANLVSTVIKIMKSQKICTINITKNYNFISESTFDDYDNPIIFTDMDNKYMTDYEKIQYILYKDYHFCLKLINNVAVYVLDKSISQDTLKTIISAYENTQDIHVVLLNYSCDWHDDLFTFSDIPIEIFQMLPSLCEYHITISNDVYPICKSLAVNRDKSIYNLRTPINESLNKENSYHNYYDKYIINSVELIPENAHNYPLESYIIYDSYSQYSYIQEQYVKDKNKINILVKNTSLHQSTSEIKSRYQDTSNMLIDFQDNNIFYDFIIVNSEEDITTYFKHMMNGSILIKIGKSVYIKHMINGILVADINEVFTIIDKLNASDDGRLQIEFLKRGSKKMGYIMDMELVESLWKLHIKNNCPVRNNNPRTGILMYIHFAMIYFIKHLDKIVGLNKDLNKEKRLEEKECEKECPNVVILVDNRPNYLSILSILFSLCNLNVTWKCKIFTSKKGLVYYEKWLGDIAEIVHSPILDVKKFHIDIYNKLLMDVNFWKSLESYDKCLIIQDDGVLLRKGLERFMKYDYIGAPWVDAPDNKYLKDHVNSDLVGNGGLSFRTVSLMKKIVAEFKKEKKNLFYKNLNNIPEDVYFVKFLKKIGANLPLQNEATIFSSEQIINNNSIGFHKVWCYHNPNDIKNFFKNILSTLEKPI